MRRMIPVTITTLVLSLLLAPLAFAAIPQGQEEQEEQEQEEQEQEQSYEETVVVSASRFEQLLMDVPVSISVITGEFIKNSASTGNYADLLRSVPGLNVTQTSARDTNMTSRQATSTLATSQLVMVDGRTVYQDFFGFVLWELLPVNRDELAQIEVQRGPSSAVWGANAMTGVVNVITKSPRAMGNWTSIRAGAGEIGTSFFSALQSGVRDKFSYKFSGAYYQQDPWPRSPSSTAALTTRSTKIQICLSVAATLALTASFLLGLDRLISLTGPRLPTCAPITTTVTRTFASSPTSSMLNRRTFSAR